MMNQTVLIADNDQNLVTGLKENAEATGDPFNIDISWDYQHAYETVMSKTPDAAIFNMDLPGMNVDLLLKNLHDQGIWFPVIVISNSISGESKETLADFGIVDFIKKPVQPKDLAVKVNDIINVRNQKDLIKNFSLPSILQLIEMDKRTGLLSIEIDGNKGTLFFKDGRVSDITVKGMNSEEALNKFIHSFYDQREISIEYLDHNKSKKIDMTLMQMVMEASRIKDEEKKSASTSDFLSELDIIENTVEPAKVGSLLAGLKEVDTYILSSPEGEVYDSSSDDYDDNLLSSGLLLWNTGKKMGEDLKLNGPNALVCHFQGGNRLIREFQEMIIIIELTKLAKYSVFKDKLNRQLFELQNEA
jgi:DNA-binding response OmpR family regulator